MEEVEQAMTSDGEERERMRMLECNLTIEVS